MKKIIISIVIIGMLLSTTPLGIGLETQINDVNLKNLNIVNKNNVVRKQRLEIPADVKIFNKDNVGKQSPQRMLVDTIITGHVFDIRTDAVITNAEIGFYIEHTDSITIWFDVITSNESGGYVFDIHWGGPPQYGYAFVSKDGYNELSYYYFSLNAGETNYVDFYLDTKPKAVANGNYYWGSVDEVNEDLLFEGTGSDVNGNIVLYEWDFDGDGIYDWSSTDNGITTHSYNTVGNYTATLKVTDDEGFSATDKMDVYVLEIRPYAHNKINILGDISFKLPESISGVVSGSGTEDDPYIIENWEIQGNGNNDFGIKISNTEDYVIIRNVTIKGAAFGFDLIKAKNVIIENCYILNSLNIGVSLIASSCIIRNNLIFDDFELVGQGANGIFTSGGNMIAAPLGNAEVTINQNIIAGFCTGIMIGTWISDNNIIKNNVIKHCSEGFFLGPCTGHDNSHIFIYHNILDQGKIPEGGSADGLDFVLYDTYETSDIFVEYNVIRSWYSGLYKDAGNFFDNTGGPYTYVGHFCVNNNNIVYCNSDLLGAWEAAVFNWDVGDPLDVRSNWWGSSDGPGCDGYGPRDYPRTDHGGVEYTPYLTTPVENAGPTTNPPPYTPQVDGASSGKVGVEYTYTAITSDPNGEEIYYLFDWDDKTTTGWLGPYASGETVSVSHTWGKIGKYQIRVIAKDSSGCISGLSSPLPIIMPYDQQSNPSPQNQPGSQQSSLQINQLLQNLILRHQMTNR